MNIAFFGASLLSTRRNGAATYFRGLLRALHARGHSVTFYEPDEPIDADRARFRDLPPPAWAASVVYPATEEGALREAGRAARSADLVVKTSGGGALDALLEEALPDLRRPGTLLAFWDTDAPGTLERIDASPLEPSDPLHPRHRAHRFLPRYDFVFTSGGGRRLLGAYAALGARRCVPILPALDPSSHYPSPADERFACDLAFMGNRKPARAQRLRDHFFRAAESLPEGRFLLAGSGWKEEGAVPPNVRVAGHLGAGHHNVFNSSARAVLGLADAGAACYGHCPGARLFEAAGAAACLLSDAWEGIESVFEPGEEILLVRDGGEVARLLRSLTPARACQIGNAALRRVLAHHTYTRRAAEVEAVMETGSGEGSPLPG